MSWIDISAPLSPTLPVWPGDPSLTLQPIAALEPDGANVSAVSMCVHTGTHLDAPLHMIAGGESVDQAPLEALCGPARVIQIDAPDVSAALLRDAGLRPGERALLKTSNSARAWHTRAFDPALVALTLDAARWLVSHGAPLVGIDGPSISLASDDPAPVHITLLGAGVWVLEGLVLGHVEPGPYELVCLPLKLTGADGAPARAMLRPRPDDGATTP